MQSDCFSMPSPITKLAFYSPDRADNLIDTLRQELNKKGGQTMRGTLLVLPEAFNLGSPYAGSQNTPSPLCELQELCGHFDVCLLAGLEHQPPGGRTINSSAYLIDEHQSLLVCGKMQQDGIGGYRPCLEGCDDGNGRLYRNIALGCLICMDAFVHDHNHFKNERDRQKRLRKKMDGLEGCQYRILCVPARITPSETCPKIWSFPNSYRIVADWPDAPGKSQSAIDYFDENSERTRLVGPKETVEPIMICALPGFGSTLPSEPTIP